MSDELNKQIATALGIEHVVWQEGYYKEQQTKHGYAGHNLWITLLDGDELWGEIFPKDWEHDLNAAWPLLLELPEGGVTAQDVSVFIDGIGVDLEPIGGKSPKDAATAICKMWLKLKHKIVVST